MQIPLPFIHRCTGRTHRNPEIRELHAYDIENVDVLTISTTEFSPGAEIVFRARTDKESGLTLRTLTRDGFHWADYGPGMLGAGKHLTKELLAEHMFRLMSLLNTTIFFDEGWRSINYRTVLRSSPRADMIESSQRERTVERLRKWASENLAIIADTLYVRVHEPSLYMRAVHMDAFDPQSGEPVSEFSFMTDVDQLYPWGSNAFAAGIHVPLDAFEEIKRLAYTSPSAVGSKGLHHGNPGQHALFRPSREDMAERSLVALSRSTADFHRGSRAREIRAIAEALAEISKHDPFERPIDALDTLADNIVIANWAYPDGHRALGRMAVELWNERLVTSPISVQHLRS